MAGSGLTTISTAQYGSGYENEDTRSAFAVVNGMLTTEEGVTHDANQEYGQHYGGDYENNDTFSNMNTSSLIPNERAKGADAYHLSQEAAVRGQLKPKKVTLSFPGKAVLTRHVLEKDIRFVESEMKNTATIVRENTRLIRNGYLCATGGGAFGVAPPRKKGVPAYKDVTMVFPGKAILPPQEWMTAQHRL